MIAALTVSPLSNRYRAELEALLGEAPRYLSLPDLRRTGPATLLRTLRTLGPHVVLPVEDESALVLLPVLEILAMVSNARTIEVIEPGLVRRAVTRRQAGRALFALGWATLLCRLAIRRTRAELARLLAEPRATSRPNGHRRIVFANGNLWFGVKTGGSIGHIAGVVNSLARKGFHVDYAGLTPPLLVAPEVGVTPIAAPTAFGLPTEANYYRFNAAMADRLVELLATPTRFLYQRMSIGNYAGVIASRRSGVPLVLEYNGSEVWAAEHWGSSLRYAELARAAEDVCIRHASLIVTISEVLRDELLARGVEAERVVWYPNCVDPAVFDPFRYDDAERAALRAELELPADALVTTFVGTFGAWHGAEVLAQAIVQLVDHSHPLLEAQRARFLFVGDGLRMPAVRTLLDREPYRSFVAFAGLVPQNEAPLHLAASDILVSPHVPNPDGSPFFGSPTKLFEYMAMGKPIVASALDQIAAVLAPGLDAAMPPDESPETDDPHCAVLCRPGAVAELSAGIAFLLERADWRETLGRNARARTLDRYIWDRHVETILAGVDRVLPPAS